MDLRNIHTVDIMAKYRIRRKKYQEVKSLKNKLYNIAVHRKI